MIGVDLQVPAAHQGPASKGHRPEWQPRRSGRSPWGGGLCGPSPCGPAPRPRPAPQPRPAPPPRPALSCDSRACPTPSCREPPAGAQCGRSPWKLGRARGSPCQHRCMRRSRWLQARGRARLTGGSSGRWPFTTFTMMCRMFFSSGRRRARSGWLWGRRAAAGRSGPPRAPHVPRGRPTPFRRTEPRPASSARLRGPPGSRSGISARHTALTRHAPKRPVPGKRGPRV